MTKNVPRMQIKQREDFFETEMTIEEFSHAAQASYHGVEDNKKETRTRGGLSILGS
jgi:hypothetical protein